LNASTSKGFSFSPCLAVEGGKKEKKKKERIFIKTIIFLNIN
jgi:hypothetical protein